MTEWEEEFFDDSEEVIEVRDLQSELEDNESDFEDFDVPDTDIVDMESFNDKVQFNPNHGMGRRLMLMAVASFILMVGSFAQYTKAFDNEVHATEQPPLVGFDKAVVEKDTAEKDIQNAH